MLDFTEEDRQFLFRINFPIGQFSEIGSPTFHYKALIFAPCLITSFLRNLGMKTKSIPTLFDWDRKSKNPSQPIILLILSTLSYDLDEA